MANHDSRRGFTLLEMLVAMTLMSILAASLYATLRTAFRARDSALAAVGPAREAHLAMDLVCRDIESALPPTGILAGEFVGTDSQDAAGRDADTLLLHSAVANSESVQVGCDVKRVEFACSSNGLVRRVTSNMLSPVAVEPTEEIICRDVSGLNFRYFDGSDWFDQWDSTAKDNALPLAIEVTLTVGRSGGADSSAKGYPLRRVLVLSCGAAAGGSAQVIQNPAQ